MKNVTNIKDARFKSIVQLGLDGIEEGWAATRMEAEAKQKKVDSILKVGLAAVRMKVYADENDLCYADLVLDYWGLEKSSASKILKIGMTKWLFSATKLLPPAQDTIYLIATLKEEQAKRKIESGDICPTTSQGEMKSLIQRIKASKASKAPKAPKAPEPTPRAKETPKPLPKKAEDELPLPTQAELDALSKKIDHLMPKSIIHKVSNDFARLSIENDYKQLKAMLDSASDNAVKKSLRGYLELVGHHAQYINRRLKSDLPQAIKDERKKLDALRKELDEYKAALDERERHITDTLPIEKIKLIRGCLHSDRVPEELKSRFDKAFIAFDKAYKKSIAYYGKRIRRK